METKRCTKCGEVKGVEEFYPHRTGAFGVTSACKRCMIKASAAYHRKNREKANALNRRWRESNPDKAHDGVREWRVNNREAYLQGMSRYHKQNAERLSDKYVKELVGKDAPPELIEAKRQQLLVHRELRKFQKLLKEQTK